MKNDGMRGLTMKGLTCKGLATRSDLGSKTNDTLSPHGVFVTWFKVEQSINKSKACRYGKGYKEDGCSLTSAMHFLRQGLVLAMDSPPSLAPAAVCILPALGTTS